MAVGYSGSVIGVNPNSPWTIYGRRDPLASPGFNPRSCRMALSRESESYYNITGNASWSGAAGGGGWQNIDHAARTNGAIPIPATEERFTLWLRTYGGRVLVYSNGTLADTSGNQSSYFDVALDWRSDLLGAHPARLAVGAGTGIIPTASLWLAARGGEVSSGTGAWDFRYVTPRLRPGWHSFTLICSHSQNTSTALTGYANPRAGSDHDGWLAMVVAEIPDSDKYGGFILNRQVASTLGTTFDVPGTSCSPNLPISNCAPLGAMPVSSGNVTQTEGNYVTTSTTFVTFDSIRPGGITNNRFTQRVLVSERGGPCLILVGMQVGENNVGETSYIDVRLDGVRLGGANGLAQHGTQVASGQGNIHLEYVTKRLNPGWHTFELMGRTANGTTTNFGNGGTTAGTNHEGWIRMHVMELYPE